MKRRAIFLLTFFICLLMLVGLLKTMYKTYRSGRRLFVLEEEITRLKGEQQRFQEVLTERQSEGFVEREARDKLNLVKSGETMVIIDEQEKDLSEQKKLGSEINNLSNPERWRYLFWGHESTRIDTSRNE